MDFEEAAELCRTEDGGDGGGGEGSLVTIHSAYQLQMLKLYLQAVEGKWSKGLWVGYKFDESGEAIVSNLDNSPAPLIVTDSVLKFREGPEKGYCVALQDGALVSSPCGFKKGFICLKSYEGENCFIVRHTLLLAWRVCVHVCVCIL